MPDLNSASAIQPGDYGRLNRKFYLKESLNNRWSIQIAVVFSNVHREILPAL